MAGFNDKMKRAWGTTKALGSGMGGFVSGGSPGRGFLGRAGMHRRAGYNMMVDWSLGRDLFKKGAKIPTRIGGALGLISTLYEGYSGFKE